MRGGGGGYGVGVRSTGHTKAQVRVAQVNGGGVVEHNDRQTPRKMYPPTLPSQCSIQIVN